ncbi:hypothetical protein ACFU8T_09760 [Sphingobacterium spiritivorum]|nr:hypothetical protein [Sphingobacterium spiritivorum]QQT35379.1 hypothetical protein I6J01_19200 [Sphingobacterium spiritivorum]WQD32065.1 hypothetical protein U0038_11150 [Sphingobacterium spiritivorum]SUJ05469.1 Uncharacterised protein [Sphingobacterium spiritivorum]
MKKRLLIFNLLILFFLVNNAVAQNSKSEYRSTLEKTLLPAPTTANLGTYGKVDISNATGGISKSISLLSAGKGDLNYNLNFNYSSIGLQVDDWGSRIGMGWNDNLTACIIREVRSIPDEQANSRVGDTEMPFTQANLPYAFSQIKNMADKNPGVDGEYDVYRYNIFGLSGSFFVKNGQIIPLDINNDVKIVAGNGGPFKFLVTVNSSGVVYRFQEAETTTFGDSEYQPYRNSSIETAWFLHSMIKNNRSINFLYSTITYSQIIGYNESWLFDEYHNNYDRWCGTFPTIKEFDKIKYDCSQGPVVDSGTKSSSLNKNRITTKVLTAVEGDLFQIMFSYQNREDIFNEKLLSKIEVFTKLNNGSDIEQIELKQTLDLQYAKVISDQTNEADVLRYIQNEPWEINSLKVRYFLEDIAISGNTVNPIHYKFHYLNKENLPPRFSFKKDFYGLYNGKNNAGLVPKEAKDELMVPWNKDDYMQHVPFANRHPTSLSSTGLLNKIQYPTGGNDSIIYEPNVIKLLKKNENRSYWNDWFTNSENAFEGNLFDMYVPISGKVHLTVSCSYDEEMGPMNRSPEEYFAQIKLVGDGINGWTNGTEWQDIPLGYSYYSTRTHLGTKQSLIFESDKDYTLLVKMYGKGTKLSLSMNYISDTTTRLVDTSFVGNRVKEQFLNDGVGNIRKISYLYHTADFRTDNTFLLNNKRSAISYVDYKDFLSGVATAPDHWAFGYGANYWYSHILNDSPVISKNVFKGLPYIYRFISEIESVGQDTIITLKEFDVSANDSESMADLISNQDLRVPYSSLRPDNSAWNSGELIKQYVGNLKNGISFIQRKTEYNYTNTSSVYYQFTSTKVYPSAYNTYSEEALSRYYLKRGALYSNFKKLTSVSEHNYFINTPGIDSLKNNTTYTYSTTDRQLISKYNLGSNGKAVLEEYTYPSQMVSTDRDPGGVYALMAYSGYYPIVETIRKVNGTQVFKSRFEYNRPFSGVYAISKVVSQSGASSPEVNDVEVINFDQYGNALYIKQRENKDISYLFSYKNYYPIAKVENLNYTQLSSALGNTAIWNFGNKIPTDVEVRNFLSPLMGTKATVSTFSFKFLDGMTSKTDAKGQTEYYKYDGLQRLQHVLDQFQQLRQSYHYHYRPQ